MKPIKNNLMLAALIIIALLLLSGCGQKQAKKDSDSDYKTGTEGLAMSFVDGAPPDKMSISSKYVMGVEISNNGAYDVVDGILAFNLEEDYMMMESWGSASLQKNELDKRKVSFNLAGKTAYNPNGEKGIVTLNVKTNSLEQQTETHTANVYATTCYNYRTEFSKTVCVDTDIINTRKVEKVCTVEDITLSGGQGGPVGVTAIKERMSPGEEGQKTKPTFMITIENLGDGEVVATGKQADFCSGTKVQKEDFNVVKITAILGGTKLKCTKDTLTLYEKSAIANCELEEGITKTADTFSSPLTIILEYGYTKTISKSVEIRRIMR